MKILVIGGMHGNEPLGPAVVKLFNKRPVTGVEAVIANKEAYKKNCRFVGQDLNRSFPGKQRGGTEEKRAKELLAMCVGFDIVLDFHNTHCPNNDCGFVGQTAKPSLYQASWALGIKRIIVADYDCINKYAPNCLSIEVSLNSPQNDSQVWYERIAQLARLDSFTTLEKAERYRFVYRMTLEDKTRLDLPSKNLRAFQPLPNNIAKALGLQSPAYPIFIGDGYTPYNYGGVLYKIER